MQSLLLLFFFPPPGITLTNCNVPIPCNTFGVDYPLGGGLTGCHYTEATCPGCFYNASDFNSSLRQKGRCPSTWYEVDLFVTGVNTCSNTWDHSGCSIAGSCNTGSHSSLASTSLEMCGTVRKEAIYVLGVKTGCNQFGQYPCRADVTEGVCVEGTSADLVNGIHTYGDCIQDGGTIYTDGGTGDIFCRFDQFDVAYQPITGNAACPSGWTQYLNWKDQTATSCGGICNVCTPYQCGKDTCYNCADEDLSCSTNSHAWADDTEPASCAYSETIPGGKGGPVCVSGTCNAILNSIGCY